MYSYSSCCGLLRRCAGGMALMMLLLLLPLPTLSPAAAAGPVIIWTSNPIAPNETAILKTPSGASFDANAQLSLCDGDGTACEPLPLVQAWERSAKATIPASRPLGSVWSVRSRTGSQRELTRLNEAEPWNALCHLSDSLLRNASARGAIGDPTLCKPGVSTLRVFGRSLGWATDGTCANFSSAAAGLATARLTLLSSSTEQAAAVAAAAVTLTASTASCYSANFELPADLSPGNYSVEVKNTLQSSTYTALGATDPSQAVLRVHVPPMSSVFARVSGGDVPALQRALNSSIGQATPQHRLVVELGPGTWRFGELESVIVPDGVHLRGAGMGSTTLEWPTQTGTICVARKQDRVAKHSGPNPNPGLISSSTRTRKYQTETPSIVLGWGLEGVTINVRGGFAQNDTMSTRGNPGLCSAIVPCMESSCARFSHYFGVDLRSINISIVAKTGGVDMKAGGVGMGAAIDLGSGCAVQGSTVTTFGNCGSNVTPLLNLNGNTALIRNNHFHNGCTIYSIRSQVGLLWESTTSHYYGHPPGGRGGNVIATFGPPFRLEYIVFRNNTQTNNPILPDGSVVKNPPHNHRIEGLTLDGGGGAYTGGVKTATASSITIASAPFQKPSTGAYLCVPFARLTSIKARVMRNSESIICTCMWHDRPYSIRLLGMTGVLALPFAR